MLETFILDQNSKVIGLPSLLKSADFQIALFSSKSKAIELPFSLKSAHFPKSLFYQKVRL